MTLALVVILSNNAFGQTLHNRTLYEMVKQTSGLNEVSGIDVGNGPKAIAIGSWNDPDPHENKEVVYVTNYDDNSVSVIDAENNTKIADIPVGRGPTAISIGPPPSIGIGPPINRSQIEVVYVANSIGNSVSVISITPNNTWSVKDIPVTADVNPTPLARGIAYDRETDNEIYVVYVAGVDSVSVIDALIDKEIAEIYIGKSGASISTAAEKAYVGNWNGNISEISIENNTWMVKEIEIPVGSIEGSPRVLGSDFIIDPETHQEIEVVYVTKPGSGSISVIDAENNKVVKEIPVGDGSTAIATGSFYL